MLKVGLLGLGGMGLGHLNQYIKLEQEGFPIKLIAICDRDERRLRGEFIASNLAETGERVDLSAYKLFRDVDEFMNEGFDFIDIVLPTDLHDEMSIKALKKGIHVLCEKPMALSSDKGVAMLRAARANSRKLMVAHCLRFWPEYEFLKQAVADERYGKVLSATFFRGGSAPHWSSDNWMLDPVRSGGALLDLHIHDVDMIHWLFGVPQAVSVLMANKTTHDVISGHYVYADGKVINAQADLSLPGEVPFEMTFRLHFQTATVIYANGKLTIYPADKDAWVLDTGGVDGYYEEIKYFAEAVMYDKDVEILPPEDTIRTMHIMEAALASAENDGAWLTLPAV